MGHPLTRRQLLRKSALVAATFPVGMVGLQGWRLSAHAQVGVPVPMNLELVTVTDTTAVITWFTGDPTQLDEFGRPAPVAAPGRVLIGPVGGPLVEVGVHEPTPYHYVEVTDLAPGTTYAFVAESNGVPATATVVDPVALNQIYPLIPGFQQQSSVDTSNANAFTTLVPPSGAEVLRIAWFNDMHFGEQIAGIVTGDVDVPPGSGSGFPPGIPVDPANPYWRFMGNAAIDEAVARGAEFLFVNGDLTNEAEPDALAEIRAALDRFGTCAGGTLDADGDFIVRKGDRPAYWVTRGNHDRAHQGAEYAGATPLEGSADYFDTFYDTFRDSWAPGSRTSKFTVVVDTPATRWRFVCLDSNDLRSGAGRLDGEQLQYLEAKLAAADEPTFVLLHHPGGFENNLLGVPPLLSGVEPEEAAAFREILGGHEDVIGVYQGHTHRNNRTLSPETGEMPFYEGGSTKEYPGGYTMVRLYEGGYMVNFHKTADPEARAWSERSRAEFFGAFPYFALGNLADRNWVFDVDARRRSTPSDASPAARGEAAGPPDGASAGPSATTAPPRALPATGGSAAPLLLAGGAAVATSMAAKRLADRADGEVPAPHH